MSSPNELPPAIFLDPWLTAEGDGLKALSQTIAERVERQISSNLSQSARRDAISRRGLVVENLVANLAIMHLSPHLENRDLLAVATAKTKATRYDREDYPKRLLSGVVLAMEELGLLIRHPYAFRERSTTVAPTPDFAATIDRQRVKLSDIGRALGAETIWLNARTGEISFADRTPLKCRIEYQDTEETILLRDQMERINAYLNQSGFRFDGEHQGPVCLRRMFLLRSLSDPHSFNLSGRLFGGWWQELRSDRRHRITIGGERITDLDFQGAFCQLMYVHLTGKPFPGDPYAIEGLEDHRGGAKLAMLTLLSRRGDLKRLSPELKAALPRGWTAKRLMDAFTRHHPALRDAIGKDYGVELMATESRIMVELLLTLKARGIGAMPLHDGVQCAASSGGLVAEAMQEVTERVLSVALPVVEKPVVGQEWGYKEAA
ncbi:hypothetical protein D4A92_09285 [Rhizobium rosettiformans]|uniref:Uncharacterized protein n=1 Tax=Rhizobium rosettiformans TaxID=1368430 RepID=A0ABX7ETF0_9HYPH|nr:hypothetical protein [Rhizobium rosettiformans]QRF51612.1 hypothetical protein D4A92_09285 [Rhizobium rosettiformans]